MLRFIITTFILASFLKAEGQFDFKTDINYNPRDISHLDSIFEIGKEYDFQLRIWTGSGLLPTGSLFLFTVKGNDTSMRYFRLMSIDSTHKLYWIEVPVQSIYAKNYWVYVNTRHILKLPTMKQILRKYRIEERRSEGISYWIELHSTKGVRGSRYFCPRSHSENYRKAKEFKWVAEILKETYRIASEKNGLCKTAANKGFSAMLASEHILIDISLISCSAN